MKREKHTPHSPNLLIPLNEQPIASLVVTMFIVAIGLPLREAELRRPGVDDLATLRTELRRREVAS